MRVRFGIGVPGRLGTWAPDSSDQGERAGVVFASDFWRLRALASQFDI